MRILSWESRRRDCKREVSLEVGRNSNLPSLTNHVSQDDRLSRPLECSSLDVARPTISLWIRCARLAHQGRLNRLLVPAAPKDTSPSSRPIASQSTKSRS